MPYMGGMTYKSRIETNLAVLSPQELEVIDDSHRHHGHAGWKEGGETHFRVRIVAEAFRGQSRLARHRLINDLLAKELAERIHALAIEARAPGEA